VEPGTLYLVATPIGNLGDITQRALDALAGVDLIAAEDTRRTRRLLEHFGIDTQITKLFEHNERARSPAAKCCNQAQYKPQSSSGVEERWNLENVFRLSKTKCSNYVFQIPHSYHRRPALLDEV
jgi:hypothetical protein